MPSSGLNLLTTSVQSSNCPDLDSSTTLKRLELNDFVCSSEIQSSLRSRAQHLAGAAQGRFTAADLLERAKDEWQLALWSGKYDQWFDDPSIIEAQARATINNLLIDANRYYQAQKRGGGMMVLRDDGSKRSYLEQLAAPPQDYSGPREHPRDLLQLMLDQPDLLTEPYQQLVALILKQPDLDNTELAEQLGINYKTCCQRLYRLKEMARNFEASRLSQD
jgi:hypothetical protein